MPSNKLVVYKFFAQGITKFLNNLGSLLEANEELQNENYSLKERLFLQTANRVINEHKKRRRKK